jgi:hypothetical protein
LRAAPSGQNRIAAFEKVGERPGRPARGARRVILSSYPSNRTPRFLIGLLSLDPFALPWRTGAGLPIYLV